MKIALSILASLVGFLFLPFEAALWLTAIVTFVSSAIFLGEDVDGVRPAPQRTIWNQFFYTTPDVVVRPASQYRWFDWSSPVPPQTNRRSFGEREEVNPRENQGGLGGWFSSSAPQPQRPIVLANNQTRRREREEVRS